LRHHIFISFFLLVFVCFNTKIISAEKNIQGNLKIFTGEWKDKCFEKNENTQKYCIIERGMFLDEKLEKRVITVIIRTIENSSDSLLTIISPLGTLIPKGFNVSLDQKKLGEMYGFSHCTKSGCFATIKINKEKIDIFKKSNAINLEYTLQNQQPLNISVSLKDFTKAYNKITKF